MRKIFFAIACAFLAAGCAAVGPDYRKPELPVPAAWSRPGSASDVAAASHRPGDLSRWWERIGDPTLTGLIERALTGSTDLRTAQAKLREARARRGLAGAQLFPVVTASAGGSRARGSEETGSGDSRSLYSAGFDASWEPDVFGGTRRGIEAAQADLEGSEEDLYATQVSITAEVALNYVEARSFQERLAIAEKNLASQLETRQLTDWRNQAGLASSLDVEQARSNLEQTRSRIPVLRTGLAEAGNRLAVLLGQAPGTVRGLLLPGGPVPAVPEEVATGIPAETLANRPDIRASERRLAAETARVGQAVAARYPGFSLNGSIGLEALTIGALGNGSALTRSILGNVFVTVFDGGRLRTQVEIQDALQEQALIAYEASVLNALEEVENALVSLYESRNQQAALRFAAEAARNAALLARFRYNGGLIDFQTVLDTERTQFTVEESLAIAKADGASSLIRLYKALGGGWSPVAATAGEIGKKDGGGT